VFLAIIVLSAAAPPTFTFTLSDTDVLSSPTLNVAVSGNPKLSPLSVLGYGIEAKVLRVFKPYLLYSKGPYVEPPKVATPRYILGLFAIV
jgi:hypothetical protein